MRVQTRDHPEAREIPVDAFRPPNQNPVQYVIHCVESGIPIEGPLSPQLCRIGQQIVDSAVKSAREGKTVPLVS